MPSTMGGGGMWFEKMEVAAVITACEGSTRTRRSPGDVGFADAFAGPFRDDGLDAVGLGGGAEQHLPADGEADGADPVLDVGALLEVGGAGQQVFVACPAHGVAFASALAARVEQQHPVPVGDEHARLVLATGTRIEQDRRPVPGGHVEASQRQAVVSGDDDCLRSNTEVGLGRLRAVWV